MKKNCPTEEELNRIVGNAKCQACKGSCELSELLIRKDPLARARKWIRAHEKEVFQ